MTENNCLIKSYSTALSCRMKQLFLCSSSSSESKILFVVLSSLPWSLKTFPCLCNKFVFLGFFCILSPHFFLYGSLWWLLQGCYLSECNTSPWARSLQASVTQHSWHINLQMPPALHYSHRSAQFIGVPWWMMHEESRLEHQEMREWLWIWLVWAEGISCDPKMQL